MITIQSSKFARGATGTPFLREVIEQGKGEIQVKNGRANDKIIHSIVISLDDTFKGATMSLRDFKASGGTVSQIELIRGGLTHVRAIIDGKTRVFSLVVGENSNEPS